MTQLRRRLEDVPYEKTDDLMKQTPPWYIHMVLAIFLALVAGVVGYGVYRLIKKRLEKQAFNQLSTGAKDMTQELQPGDDENVREQELSQKHHWTSTDTEMAPPRQGNHNQYVSMTEDSLPHGEVV